MCVCVCVESGRLTDVLVWIVFQRFIGTSCTDLRLATYLRRSGGKLVSNHTSVLTELSPVTLTATATADSPASPVTIVTKGQGWDWRACDCHVCH